MQTQSTTLAISSDLRTATLTTRLAAEEMRAVEAAAAATGITRSMWLRNATLAYLDKPSPTPHLSLESTILEELMGLRLLILNLFAAATPGLALQTMHQIMAHADSSKHIEATKVMSHAGLK